MAKVMPFNAMLFWQFSEISLVAKLRNTFSFLVINCYVLVYNIAHLKSMIARIENQVKQINFIVLYVYRFFLWLG